MNTDPSILHLPSLATLPLDGLARLSRPTVPPLGHLNCCLAVVFLMGAVARAADAVRAGESILEHSILARFTGFATSCGTSWAAR